MSFHRPQQQTSLTPVHLSQRTSRTACRHKPSLIRQLPCWVDQVRSKPVNHSDTSLQSLGSLRQAGEEVTQRQKVGQPASAGRSNDHALSPATSREPRPANLPPFPLHTNTSILYPPSPYPSLPSPSTKTISKGRGPDDCMADYLGTGISSTPVIS